MNGLPAAIAELGRYLQDGSLRSFTRIYDGLEATPGAFCDMMHGATRDKCLVRLEGD